MQDVFALATADNPNVIGVSCLDESEWRVILQNGYQLVYSHGSYAPLLEVRRPADPFVVIESDPLSPVEVGSACYQSVDGMIAGAGIVRVGIVVEHVESRLWGVLVG